MAVSRLSFGLVWVSLAVTARAQLSLEQIHSFGFGPQLGDYPRAGVIEGADGWLYGTTLSGGIANLGTVFKVRKDGTGYLTLHQFTGAPGDGSKPLAELLEASDGALYGTTWEGGSGTAGTVFKLLKDGTGYTVLLHLDGPKQGGNLLAGLSEEGGGRLYGAAARSGPHGFGTLFRLNRDGSGFELLHSFGGGSGDGAQPHTGLLQGGDGLVYGATRAGGSLNAGMVFRMNRNGTGFALLHSFSGPADGRACSGGLAEGTDRRLYGVANEGGSFGAGTLYALDRDGGNFSVLHHFGQGGSDGQNPEDGVVQGKDGALYGIAYTGGDYMNGTVFKINPDGTSYTNLHQFNGGEDDGYRPEGPLCLASDGALYGTTSKGGRINAGLIFKLNPDGTGYARLRSFSITGGDATSAYGRVLEASDGFLYGMATAGGAREGGAVFKVHKDGSGYAILHDFTWETDDGFQPYGGFAEGRDGALYGTTGYGGGAARGTVFKINRDGSGYTILHRFSGAAGTGAYPSTGLILASDGGFYGRTISGGAGDGATVFRFDPDASTVEVIHSFADNGGYLYSPDANLIEGLDASLYSATYGDGTNHCGTVWRLHKDGSRFLELHTFANTGGDGYYPDGGLLQAPDGTLYGTTTYGGLFDGGTVYKIAPDGSGYSILRSFNPTNSEGYWPRADLVWASPGVLLGVTYAGGRNDGGTVYTFDTVSSYCSVLHPFTPSVGMYPFAGLSRSADGALYGVTPAGGDYDLGTVFRLPAFILGGRPDTSGGFLLWISGLPGQRYALDASDTLPANWGQCVVLTNLTGTATWTDVTPSPNSRFYRAQWVLP
jgi:uncharacterized repeat protein (TIGR03803 family)